MTEMIPFRIVLSAPDHYIRPFLTARSPSSFLQLGSNGVVSDPAGPVRVHIMRRISAEARETGVVVLSALTTLASRGFELAEGGLNKVDHGPGWIGWWGEIHVLPDRVGPGGFVADRLVVQDELVVTLNLSGIHTHTFPFRQVVPIRLTTDLAGTSEALQVTEV
ncbi:hypothetical protein B0F90DRAFT_1720487 [Multifurca ochricompacta]|uniref:Uncharacterized protein n=1 Tax=Multifurca ochricompacta TaxID=376703 RepID=A0AAD4M4S9_9AGAM|nr:hypothetical protein B0F90DRAFT_1720487 [Multifurca ochricompacta]